MPEIETNDSDLETVVVHQEGLDVGPPPTVERSQSPGKEDELAAGAQLGRYELTHRLGAGGMGVVFAAHDPQLDRDVAVKVLLTDRGRARTPDGRARLLREAQAMAKLSHANVVPVFDVGIDDGRVFVAMELVHGKTLAEWLDTNPDVARVLDVVMAAGRGLAAAHAAGFVHRDFKPANVMVTDDDRALVMDFGLARALDGDGTSPSGASQAISAPALDSLTNDSESIDCASKTPALTRAGVVMGTPAYMAPEQHRGRVPDARADQFAFCVTAWEALCGQRPYIGGSVVQLAIEKTKGEPIDLAGALPSKVGAVLRRGLRPRPEERFSTMPELLDALTGARAPSKRWTWAGLSLGVGVMAAAVAVAVGGADDAPPCSEAGGTLTAVYDDASRQEIEAAFGATEAPFAADAWRAADARLSEYAAAWSATAVEACEAGRNPGADTDTVTDLRHACLERAEVAFTDRVQRLKLADRTTVEQVFVHLARLPPVDRCSQVDVLEAEVPPPSDPKDAARARLLSARLASLHGDVMGGDARQAKPDVLQLVDDARALAYPPLVAEALGVLGLVQETIGEFEAADTTWTEGAWLAAGAGADAIAVAIATRLIQLQARERVNEAAAMDWARNATAWLSRGHPNPLAQAKLDNAIGMVHSHYGRYDEAAEYYQRSYEAKRALLGDDDFEVIGELANVAIAAAGRGQLDTALALFGQVAQRREALLGPKHPQVGAAQHNLGGMHDLLGHHAEAAEAHRRAIAILTESLGPEHPRTAINHDALGSQLAALGQFDEAREHLELALVITGKVFGNDHPEVAWVSGNLGLLAYQERNYEEALECFERVLVTAIDVYGDQHDAVGLTHANQAAALAKLGRIEAAKTKAQQAVSELTVLAGGDDSGIAAAYRAQGTVLMEAGELTAALAAFERALPLLEAALPPGHPEIGSCLFDVASTQRRLGRSDDARPVAERAHTLLTQRPIDPRVLAAAKFLLAQLRWDADRGGSRVLAQEALGLYEPDDVAFAPDRELVARWLGEHLTSG